jgi:hypothetical protein
MASNDFLERSILPIPDRKPVSLTTYTAKNLDTKFPPNTPLSAWGKGDYVPPGGKV